MRTCYIGWFRSTPSIGGMSVAPTRRFTATQPMIASCNSSRASSGVSPSPQAPSRPTTVAIHTPGSTSRDVACRRAISAYSLTSKSGKPSTSSVTTSVTTSPGATADAVKASSGDSTSHVSSSSISTAPRCDANNPSGPLTRESNKISGRSWSSPQFVGSRHVRYVRRLDNVARVTLVIVLIVDTKNLGHDKLHPYDRAIVDKVLVPVLTRRTEPDFSHVH